MGGEACACEPEPARRLPDHEPDHLYDHHSSEEELEVSSLGVNLSAFTYDSARPRNCILKCRP